MKNTSAFIVVLLLVSLAIAACSSAAPTPAATQEVRAANTQLNVETATATATALPISSPTPTDEQLKLEIVQSQTWTDRDGNTRANVLFRNPYDVPVAPSYRARGSLVNAIGKSIRDQELYFLDGISGGNGFLLPGETIAANACFTCERAPLKEVWSSVGFLSGIEDATGHWNYYTEVEASAGDVSFDGDSPIFWVTGTVRNNSDTALSRISARIFVFDQDGNLVGAAEASAWDVAPGATASFSGNGIGNAPAGSVKYEVTALGVKY